MSYKLTVLLLTALATAILARPPDITFLCNEMPEICTNMCWAVRCAQPSFSQIFTPDPSVYGTSPQNKSAISADCRINNLCGNLHGLNKTGHRNHPYSACNIYPFSITSEGAAYPPPPPAHQVSRCVPEEEQCKQRTQLELLSKRLQKQSAGQQGTRQLSINFGNPGGIKFCSNDPCVNDGFEVQDGTVGRRSEAPMFTYYRAKSGMIIASLDDIETPSTFTRRVGSGELVAPGFNTWFEHANEETVHMMEDAITQRLSAQPFVG
ncbi:deoxyribonuclease nuca nucb domain-containing [Trichoderma arundinaceum]|uniref:Deoxyribonuclease nuca nucb domain-containing n=1 Tax=Trichoderma arundinaceum TaxID=490622 RepID=A0A395NQ02_TRIAR|nr:deoxyribonuclease nuca nucb domain-containing [Trichoderma arundinaceum]